MQIGLLTQVNPPLFEEEAPLKAFGFATRCSAHINKENLFILKLDFEKAYDWVSWDFLQGVVFRKGFDPLWVSWIMQLARGGQSTVNINGDPGPFFQNSRGVRQGDLISPLLFNLVVDVLAVILDGARKVGHIRNVSPEIREGGFTHLQYADGTLIIIQDDPVRLTNLKKLLRCFESMSGLKINFDKSEAYVISDSLEEKLRAVHMMNCKLGCLPIKYLGMLLIYQHLTIQRLCVHYRSSCWKSGTLDWEISVLGWQTDAD